MKQSKTNHTAQLLKSPNGGFRGLYTTPVIELIKLDNEISLALQSAPPDGPGEVNNNYPATFSNSPFKNPTV